ncbi:MULTISPECIES: hypothetical protein [unclassified Snodgrassella]|uniref:hypothetical protein n=1 Tax=unclassified Snodgrassella TaxID=2625236 RepID=UPI0018DEBC6D|nr:MULTISPECIES: hypothetical protein [unclassified Snodgrassella]MBI0097253.1 hypothetical protein [Snodgrassella sp. W8134]MBI0101014.1 hypothetical protein [Snodgrassella sp. W8135]
MAVIRTKREDKFTVVGNIIFQPGKLSFDARGLLCTLLSKPDDWSVIVKALENETKGCRKHSKADALYAMLKELKEAGYVVMKRRSTGEVDYFVYDTPQIANSETANNGLVENPNRENPEEAKTQIGEIPNRENPRQGKSPTGKIPNGENPCVLINTNTSNKEKNNNNKNINKPEKPETAKKAKKAINQQNWNEGMKLLLAEGIDEQVAKDYLVVRETKKAALTKTAMDGNKREANKAGITLEAAIRVCIENNWRAFIAEWYANRNKNKSSDPSVKNNPKPSVKEIPEHTEGGVQAWL